MVAGGKVHCSVCGSTRGASVLEIPDVPVYCNVLWSSQNKALSAPTGDISLQFCQECGHVFNTAFDPAQTDYTASYDNSLHFSERFNAYAEALADRLIETYGLHGKDIVEIGCGKGDFLRMLCGKGGNRGKGYDRSYEPDRTTESSPENVTFVQDFYQGKYAQEPVDFICCRHVLEHIENPTDLLRDLHGWISGRQDVVLYFEVPNGMFTIESLGIWDLIYEHCSYFTRRSLVRAFELAEFEILALDESFDGQYLYVEARAKRGSTTLACDPNLEMTELERHIAAFDAKYQSKVQSWQRKLAAAPRHSTVVWGGGSKGVTFLNVLKDTGGIEYIVDLNPHKQGKFVPGTGQEVVAPEFLQAHRPERVVVMNSIYLEEIGNAIKSMGVDTVLEGV